MSTQLKRTEAQIEGLKQELWALGPMRPGSITRQYRLPTEKERPFYQISYTHCMRSRSEYVRREHLAALRKETATFKRFKTLISRWVGLALKASQLRVRYAAKTPRHTP
jgi:ferredoxin-NADP reductase